MVKDEEDELDLASLGIGGSGPVKHAGHGALRLLKNVAFGVVGGAGTFVAAPIIGAREGGITGFAQGLGAGLVGTRDSVQRQNAM